MAGVAEAEQPTGGGPATKKHQDEETQGLEKVTDYVEEKENSAELGQAVSIIESDISKKNEAKAKRDQELARIVIKKEEVELIVRAVANHTQMKELDLSKAVAERSLREHKGDLIKALHALIE